jgi:hypothetical protein
VNHHLFELELHLGFIDKLLINDVLCLIPNRGHCELSLDLVASMKAIDV